MFHEAFPVYLAMGMSYREFWEMDPTLVRAYRKAKELRDDEKNQELWLQGMYIYEALCDVAPILRAFGKKGQKPHKYPEKPYTISEKARRKEQRAKDKKVFDVGLGRMKALMNANNAKLEHKEVNEVADPDRLAVDKDRNRGQASG